MGFIVGRGGSFRLKGHDFEYCSSHHVGRPWASPLLAVASGALA